MTDRWRWTVAGITLLGGGLAVISSVPGAWYGYIPGDSYVFDPVRFSPLWIQRTLLPLFSLAAGFGLLVGVGALVYRDWAHRRLHRVGGTATVLGGLTLLCGLYGPEFLTPHGTPVGVVASLAALALLLWGGVLLLVGGPLLAYSYLRAGRVWLGWTLLGTLPVVLLLGALLPGWIGDLGSSMPILVLGIVIGRDLLVREPVPEFGVDLSGDRDDGV